MVQSLDISWQLVGPKANGSRNLGMVSSEINNILVKKLKKSKKINKNKIFKNNYH